MQMGQINAIFLAVNKLLFISEIYKQILIVFKSNPVKQFCLFRHFSCYSLTSLFTSSSLSSLSSLRQSTSNSSLVTLSARDGKKVLLENSLENRTFHSIHFFLQTIKFVFNLLECFMWSPMTVLDVMSLARIGAVSSLLRQLHYASFA